MPPKLWLKYLDHETSNPYSNDDEHSWRGNCCHTSVGVRIADEWLPAVRMTTAHGEGPGTSGLVDPERTVSLTDSGLVGGAGRPLGLLEPKMSLTKESAG